jgi:hypothetical protein
MAIANQQDIEFFFLPPLVRECSTNRRVTTLVVKPERDVLTFTEYATFRDLSQTKTSASRCNVGFVVRGNRNPNPFGFLFFTAARCGGGAFASPESLHGPVGS